MNRSSQDTRTLRERLTTALPGRSAEPALPDPATLDPEDAEAYAALKARRAERRRRKLIHRGIALGIILAIALIGVAAAALLNRQPEETYEPIVDFVTAGTYTTEVDARGKLEPLSSTVIAPTVDGTIAEVRVSAGQQVNAGDVLLVIDNPGLDAAVADAARALSAAQEEKRAADRALGQAQQEAARPAPVDPETGAALETSPVDVAAAQDAVNAAQRSVEAAQAALDQANARAAERTVTSPIGGSVVTLNAQVGANLADAASSGSSGAGPLMQIADLSQMKVTVQVSEEDIAQVAIGQQARLTFPAFDNLTLDGTVNAIASIASGSSDMAYYGDGSSVTFAVDVLVPAPDPRLKPGMTAQVSLMTEKLDQVVMVPTMALMTDDGTSYYVQVEVDPETHETERRDVEVYARNADFAVVGAIEGAAAPEGQEVLPPAPLTEGETLVISGGMGFAGDLSGATGGGAAADGAAL